MEELSKNYDSEALEPRILDKWLTGGYYARRPGVGDCTVTIPPPNVITPIFAKVQNSVHSMENFCFTACSLLSRFSCAPAYRFFLHISIHMLI